MDTGHTAWMLISCALVLLMTPGLALFYGGMVGRKNVLSTFMHSFIAMGVMTLVWVVYGYSLAFAESRIGYDFIGGFDHVLLAGITPASGDSYPELLNVVFQGMFFIITPALISGAVAERMKFGTYIAFIVLWGTLVYLPICHWVWGPGDASLPLSEGGKFFGGMDFAGGLVVHLSSGVSALVFAIMIGKRRRVPPPHNLTMTLLGAGLLWFGWFGFNAGSALAADGIAAAAFLNTHIAAAAALCSWLIVENQHAGKPTALGAASGLVAGLVVITPAAGFVGPSGALLMGLAAGVVCYGGIVLKGKLGYDDALDAFGVHGIGGATGAILTGVFALEAWGGRSGLLEGNSGALVTQIRETLITAGYAVAVSFVLLFVLDRTMGLRVDPDEETEGLDAVVHGENGYMLGTTSGHRDD